MAPIQRSIERKTDAALFAARNQAILNGLRQANQCVLGRAGGRAHKRVAGAMHVKGGEDRCFRQSVVPEGAEACSECLHSRVQKKQAAEKGVVTSRLRRRWATDRMIHQIAAHKWIWDAGSLIILPDWIGF